MTIEDLEQQFDEAAATLELLQTERKRLPRDIAESVALRDSKALAALTKRQAELPDELYQAEIAAIQAEMALLEAEQQLDATALAALKPQRAQAEEAVKAAQKALLDLQQSGGRIQQRVSSRQDKRNRNLRRLEAVLLEQAGQSLAQFAPVVRSLPHAPHINKR